MKYYRNIALFTMILAFCVVVLGAFTRLTDAGLGCPDWPGCYGQLVLPSKVQALQIAQEHYPHSPIESRKAWTEMSHRYVAGTLVILVIILNGFAWRYRRQGAPRGVSLLLLGLIGFQAALGMWTVTLKLLPVVVMGHLLGGLLTFVSLVYLNWRLSGYSGARRPAWRGWVNLGIGIVFCQIALGGWVSANYAGIACVGFPTCNGQWLPQLYWLDSFHFWSKIGENYQGGLLESAYRVTIQVVHRFGASVTLVYVALLSCVVLYRVNTARVKWVVVGLLSCLVVQCLLGIANVLYLLPLGVAVAHNAVAALLLAAIVSLRYSLVGAPHVRVT